MRIRVTHRTRYTYAPPAKGAIQLLRLTPRGYDGQHVRAWRLDADCDCRLRPGEDALGNVTHTFNADGPLESLVITVEGEVETQDTAGVVRGTVEPFPPALFLRDTALTTADEEIRAFAAEGAAEAGADALGLMHAMTARLHANMRFEIGATDAATAAAEAFGRAHGVCQDFAHVLIAAARSRDIPARYVSGYLVRSDGAVEQDAGHAWVEAHVEGLGWVGFDPANGISPSDAYVRVAVGLDYLGAAPVLGARHGGGRESLSVEVRVEGAPPQMQTQSQS
jgi:transglutaminase-like putative cysteine protease